MLRYQRVVPAGVVGHPIQEHAQAQGVGRVYEVAQVGEGTEFGVHAEVVAHGVLAAQSALAGHLPNGVNGHQPDNAHAHVWLGGAGGLQRPGTYPRACTGGC